jgi:micrococcal nuclease
MLVFSPLFELMRVLKPLAVIIVLGVIIAVFYQMVLFPMLFGKAKILTMIDPDSLLVRENGKVFKVQLIGADAPELTGYAKSHQCYDYQALQKAAEFFKTSREISLSIDATAGEKDTYGRELRYVTMVDGTIYNLKLIQNGLAKESNPQKKDYKYKDDFLKAEAGAQKSGIGIWNPATCGGKF